MNRSELESVARELVAAGKGILAADESFPTIEKRFKSVNVSSTQRALYYRARYNGAARHGNYSSEMETARFM
jgi:fructose-bisphosphate aldolase class 1